MAEHPGAHGRTGATSSPTHPHRRPAKPARTPRSTPASERRIAVRGRGSPSRPWPWWPSSSASSQSSNRPATQQAGRRDTVTIGLKLAPTNLDIRNQSGSALDQILIGNVYEGLVARDENNQVVPALAASWEESADGLTYTFHLNEGMRFSNGDELNADDVVWSIRELVDKQYHDASSLTNFDSITAVDLNTVELRLSAPNSNLLWTLAGRCGLVFDQDAEYDMKTEAIGSGPYLVSEFRANDSITLKANPNYWGEHRAKTETVVVRYFTDDNAAVNALASGDVQVLAPISENLAGQFADDPDHYTVQAGDGTDKYVLAFNGAGEHTSIRVSGRPSGTPSTMRSSSPRAAARRAARRADSPRSTPGYEDLTDLYPHDVDKALELMAEAGYGADNPLTLRLEYSNTYGTDLGGPAALATGTDRHRPEGGGGGVLHMAAGRVHEQGLRPLARGPQRKPRLLPVGRPGVLLQLRQRRGPEPVRAGARRHR